VGTRTDAPSCQRKQFSSPLGREDFLTGLVSLAPTVVVTLVFVVFPVLFSLHLSFHRWDVLRAEKPFVGFANYVSLFSDKEFWKALANTAIYTAGVVPVQAAVALAFALLLNRPIRGRDAYRTAYFMPVITSSIVAAVVWTWIYNPQYGMINVALRALGIQGPAWLLDPKLALASVMAMSVWKNAGYHLVIFLAGLQTIPRTLYESAEIDGAGAGARFRHITWPLLRPTTGLVLISGMIFSFQVFGPVYIMTGGGPMRSTTVVLYYIYQQGFELRRMGYASAVAWIVFLIILVFTLAQFRMSRRGATQ
jgi:multiple sugar transport system permease protein